MHTSNTILTRIQRHLGNSALFVFVPCVAQSDKHVDEGALLKTAAGVDMKNDIGTK